MDDFDEYYYDYNNDNMCDYDDHNVSGLIDDDWLLDYEDEQIWLDVKAEFEKRYNKLMGVDFDD